MYFISNIHKYKHIHTSHCGWSVAAMPMLYLRIYVGTVYSKVDLCSSVNPFIRLNFCAQIHSCMFVHTYVTSEMD